MEKREGGREKKNIKIEWNFLFSYRIELLRGVKKYMGMRYPFCIVGFKSKNLESKATETEMDQRSEVKF